MVITDALKPRPAKLKTKGWINEWERKRKSYGRGDFVLIVVLAMIVIPYGVASIIWNLRQPGKPVFAPNSAQRHCSIQSISLW